MNFSRTWNAFVYLLIIVAVATLFFNVYSPRESSQSIIITSRWQPGDLIPDTYRLVQGIVTVQS